jgi:hypothetical protein
MIKPVPFIRFVWTYQGRFRPGRSVGNGRSRSAGNRGRRERFGSMPLSWSLLSWAHHPTPWACARPNYGDIVTASLNMFLTLRVALAIHRFAPAHVKHLEELLPSRCARLAWNPGRCARSVCPKRTNTGAIHGKAIAVTEKSVDSSVGRLAVFVSLICRWHFQDRRIVEPCVAGSLRQPAGLLRFLICAFRRL